MICAFSEVIYKNSDILVTFVKLFKPEMPRLCTYFLFLLTLVFLTDTASAAETSLGGDADTEVLCERSEKLAHGSGEQPNPFVWDCVAAELTVSCGQSGWDTSKFLVRQLPIRYGCKSRVFADMQTCGYAHAVVFGPVSSDFYVLAYRKIVI